MKVIASILILYLGALVIAPMPCAIASFVERSITCEYASDEGNPCDESSNCSKEKDCNSNNDCSTSLCCNLQCCNCYYLHKDKLSFFMFSEISSKYAFPESDKITSAFLGECWQPPELI